MSGAEERILFAPCPVFDTYLLGKPFSRYSTIQLNPTVEETNVEQSRNLSRSKLDKT